MESLILYITEDEQGQERSSNVDTLPLGVLLHYTGDSVLHPTCLFNILVRVCKESQDGLRTY
jgi:hypothetical protein